MAGQKSTPSTKKSTQAHKLTRLPKNARVQKRPLLHPPIPSPYTGSSQQKVVYISSSTPFVCAVKRVRKLLDQIDKRAVGAVDLINGPGGDKQKLKKLGEQVNAAKKGKEKEEVVLKATGRSIERALSFGVYFQGQGDLDVKIRTGTVGTVDDIVVESGDEGEERADGGDVEEDVPEARVRFTSMVEVAITLK